MSPREIARNGANLAKQLAQEHVVHAAVVVFVVMCVTFLGSRGEIDHNTVGFVYATAIGYAAGRSGTVHRSNDRDPDA